MAAEDNGGTRPRKSGKSFRWVVLLTFLFVAWVIVSVENNTHSANSLLTNVNVQYILTGFFSIIGNSITELSTALSSISSSISQNPANVDLLAAPIAVTGMIPLYLLVKRGSESGALGFLVSLLYLFCTLSISTSWFSLAYLSVFPALMLWGFAFYVFERKILAFIFAIGIAFSNPIGAAVILAFSLGVFYKSWDDGNQKVGSNLFSIILEGVSGFIFIIFLLKYSYKFFIFPNLVYNANQSAIATYNAPHFLSLMSNFFANFMPLVPEFTQKQGLLLSLVVIGVVAVMGALSKIALNRVQHTDT